MCFGPAIQVPYIVSAVYLESNCLLVALKFHNVVYSDRLSKMSVYNMLIGLQP